MRLSYLFCVAAVITGSVTFFVGMAVYYGVGYAEPSLWASISEVAGIGTVVLMALAVLVGFLEWATS